MANTVVHALVCPTCGGTTTAVDAATGKTAFCWQGHSYQNVAAAWPGAGADERDYSPETP